MNAQSIYSTKQDDELKSTRYIFAKVKNVSWIVNRISSLFRRRRYNMDEFSVDFNNDNTANIVIVIDWDLFDIWQIVNQISKIYDVIDVYDATYQKELLYYTFFIDSDTDALKWYKNTPEKAIKVRDAYKLLFQINIDEKAKFQEFLIKNKFTYKERLTPLF
jgi:acetolactate synthase regulatory subunit